MSSRPCPSAQPDILLPLLASFLPGGGRRRLGPLCLLPAPLCQSPATSIQSPAPPSEPRLRLLLTCQLVFWLQPFPSVSSVTCICS